MPKSYYEILGVDENASVEDIRKAYFRLVKKHHPDVSQSDKQKFLEIQEAYQVLSDNTKRSQYDQSRKGGFFSGGNNYEGGRPFNQFFTFEFGRSGMEDILDKFFNVDFFDHAREEKDRLQLSISFEESCTGTEKTIEYQRNHFCTHCMEKGCRNCAFSGFQRETARMRISIPSMIENNSEIAVANGGTVHPRHVNNLFILIKVSENDFKTRVKLDILETVWMSLDVSLVGGICQHKDIYGLTMNVKVPQGIQSGDKIVVKERGIKFRSMVGDYVFTVFLRTFDLKQHSFAHYHAKKYVV